jgi:hypothetical protein
LALQLRQLQCARIFGIRQRFCRRHTNLTDRLRKCIPVRARSGSCATGH